MGRESVKAWSELEYGLDEDVTVARLLLPLPPLLAVSKFVTHFRAQI